MTGTVLVIVLATKFADGAYIAILGMVVFYLLMLGIHSHYDRVTAELMPRAEPPILPVRNHAVIFVSKLHSPTVRALAYARATRPDTLQAVTVNIDDTEAHALKMDWERQDTPVPLVIVDSPYREITAPLLEYVKDILRQSPRDVVTVFIPEYVVGHWWENILHNQSALRLKGRLLFERGVMVTSVPWQLRSADRRDIGRQDQLLHGSRLGTVRRPDAPIGREDSPY
jgi:hypothetical protein